MLTSFRVGTRHVKVWRTEESMPTPTPKSRQSDVSFLPSGHKSLPGRNCLLGTQLETNFTSVVAVAPNKAIVASDKGDICLMDDADGGQRFTKIAEAGFGVTSMAVDTKGRLHLASNQGGVSTLNIMEMINAFTPPPSPPPSVESSVVNLTATSFHVEAIVPLLDYLVTVDSQHSIRLSNLYTTDETLSVGEVVQKLPAHCDAVLGVDSLKRPNSVEASFYTWSAGGSVLFWGQDGTCKDSLQVPLEQIDGEAEPNELKAVCASDGTKYVVIGDKYGVLRYVTASSGPCC